jgi:uncharacterized protein (TIGR02466 family)
VANQIDKPETRAVIAIGLPDHAERSGRLRVLLLEMAATVPDAVSFSPDKPSYFHNKWRSGNDLFQHPDAEIGRLVAAVEERANARRWPGGGERPLRVTSMWAIVGRDGFYGEPHVHEGVVSGVYYVDAGDGDGGANGAFAVYDRQHRPAHLIPPRSGLLILFPARLPHGVMPYRGTRPRIVIAFNLA